MKYYAVHTEYTDPFQPMHIKDKRKIGQIARDILEEGFLSSQSVRIRQTSIAFNDGGTSGTQHFFSADPLGAIVFMADRIRHISEVVVPDDAELMPD
jgi:hypothetical protein